VIENTSGSRPTGGTIVGACTLRTTESAHRYICGRGAVQLTRDHAGQPWRARQREILNRIVRETESPTDSLPLGRRRERKEPDDHYDARLGEVLDLAGSIGAILMASGMPATATMEQVTAITAAYGINRCEVDVINTTIHVSAYRGPTLPPASTLHIVQSRSTDFSRLAAVDRLIGRIRAHQVSASQALDQLDAIVTAPHPYKRWIATLAWGALAGVRDRGDAGRGLAGLLGQRAEHDGDRPR
jgi:hypothetical protein